MRSGWQRRWSEGAWSWEGRVTSISASASAFSATNTAHSTIHQASHQGVWPDYRAARTAALRRQSNRRLCVSSGLCGRVCCALGAQSQTSSDDASTVLLIAIIREDRCPTHNPKLRIRGLGDTAPRASQPEHCVVRQQRQFCCRIFPARGERPKPPRNALQTTGHSNPSAPSSYWKYYRQFTLGIPRIGVLLTLVTLRQSCWRLVHSILPHNS